MATEAEEVDSVIWETISMAAEGKKWVGCRGCVLGFRDTGFRVSGFRVPGFRIQDSGIQDTMIRVREIQYEDLETT